MMRCLVTGAAGFIGSHLCEALLARGDEVVGVDSFSEYYDPKLKRANLADALAMGLDFRAVDLIRDALDSLLARVDVVFHLAGQPGVRDSWQEFSLYAERNLLATQHLLETCARTKPGRVVFASSSSVYGERNGKAAGETDPRAPVSPYGLSKAACEDLLDVYRRTAGLSMVALRYFTVYGPRQRPEMAFARFITRVLADEPVPIFGDGRQRRDFTYVDDAVAATVAAAAHGERPAYNVSGGASASVREAIAEIERIIGRKARVEFVDAARGDPRSTRADLSAVIRDLEYRPVTALRVGLERQIEAARRQHGAESVAA
jgi:nucleoside-diphosphate-sugar epimerase